MPRLGLRSNREFPGAGEFFVGKETYGTPLVSAAMQQWQQTNEQMDSITA